MQSGKESAASLTKRYLRRIEELDRHGPELRAVIEINPDAPAIARALDRERKAKGPRGPLHGIPVLIKDNIDTHDRMMTTAGSLALLGSIASQDSFVAKKLREAGAVILGKANLSEWANFRGDRSSSGWSGRGGQTKNPYVLDRNPSGSSSGSAAAVSANLCVVAVGTETDGSIISPSTVCGIVGIKPTVGLISRSGIIPISKSQDTAGPMARTVTDAAILLGALAGEDPRDEATAASRGKLHPDYAQFLDANGLRGAQIGVARKYREAGSSYVCRVREDHHFTPSEVRSLSDADRAAGVTFDAVGNLGSAKSKRIEHPDHLVRMVHIRMTPHPKRGAGHTTPVTLVLVTNLLDLPAELIGVLFHYRWAIELFFRFFKHVLGCRHLLSHDPVGIQIQTYCTSSPVS